MKEELIIKFLNNQCSEDELKQISAWLESADYEAELDKMFSRRLESIHLDGLTYHNQNILEKIHDKLEEAGNIPSSDDDEIGNVSTQLFEGKKRGLNYNYYSKIAASVAILLFSAVALIALFIKNTGSQDQVAEAKHIHKETGYGEKLRMILPDGTRVIMNSSSTIVFPDAFAADSERVVKLSGEAYFEVVHDEERPFKVVTGLMETTVLGTKFNVSEREDKAAVTLAEGKVLVGLKNAEAGKQVELSPGEMAHTKKSNRNLEVKNVNAHEIIAWTEGVIAFKSAPFGEVISKLEEWYAVDITLDEKVDTLRKVSGEFNNENLQNILTGLSFSMEFQYSISGKKVIIKKDKL